jgi:hypothetical protein
VILDQVLGGVANGSVGRVGGEVLAAIAVIASGRVLWKLRRERTEAAGFGEAAALVLALTVLVVPMYAPYNQVLLLPAILLLARERGALWLRSRGLRWGYLIGGFALAWQWIASLALTAIYLLVSRPRALDGWSWPFFATFAVPVIVFVLIFFYVKQSDLHPGGAD